MEYDGCIYQIQQYLENSPLIVLGSGASIPYGLPSMSDLATEIGKHSTDFEGAEFDEFCLNLSTMNLEEALDASELSHEAQNMIRQIVWAYVNRSDKAFFYRLIADSSEFAICSLLKKVIQPAQNSVNVVTTNYDRVVEYATDLIGATNITGFEGAMIKEMELPSNKTTTQRIRARERTVSLWKVHGSLDWFRTDGGKVRAYPLTESIPLMHSPLIIPPGKDKYSMTHSEPYRSVISKADESFSKASSYLCIGYGFNDEHVQPKLLTEIGNGKPIVVLARQATLACKKHLVDAKIRKYIIIEEAPEGKTSVTSNGWNGVYDGHFWELSEFMKIW